VLSFLFVTAPALLLPRSILVLATAACLVAAPAASAERVGWNEKAKVGGKPVMSYKVVSLTFGKSGWSARVSFRNLSQQTIRVGNEFGVGFWSSSKATSLADVVGFAAATKFSSTPPKVLKPGASWTGVISGSGELATNRRVYARVVFGPFSGFPGARTPVFWLTDHVKAYGSGASPPPAAGPVI
jgi:hypothetical protein